MPQTLAALYSLVYVPATPNVNSLLDGMVVEDRGVRNSPIEDCQMDQISLLTPSLTHTHAEAEVESQ
jgi:hypothetical protein